MPRLKLPVEKSQDLIGCLQPPLVGVSLVLNHGRERIQLAGKPAAQSLPARRMYEAEKQGQPGFHGDEQPVLTEYASSFRENLIKVIRQSCQMMKTSLHDEEILALIGKGQLCAVPDVAVCKAAVLSNQSRRKINAL